MNFLSLGEKLSSQIVEILAEESRLKTADIQSRLLQKFNSKISLPTLYRRIEELIEAQVVFRYRMQHSLHPIWVDRYIRNAWRLNTAKNILSSKLVELPKKEGELKKFYAESLLELDEIWNIVQLEVISNSGEGRYYGYNSHSWHALAIEDSEREVYKSMIERGAEVGLIVGNNTALDEYGIESIKLDGFHNKISLAPPFLREGYAVWASSKYVVECELPLALTKEFSRHFKEIKDPLGFDKEIFLKLFKKKIICVLKVWKDQKRANDIQQAIRRAA